MRTLLASIGCKLINLSGVEVVVENTPIPEPKREKKFVPIRHP